MRQKCINQGPNLPKLVDLLGMTQALLFKQLFIYLLPFNLLVGEYGLSIQYRFNQEWAADLTLGYQDAIEGSPQAEFYQDVMRQGVFYYSGPVAKVSVLSLVPRGPNPLKTDYNQMELGYRYLGYDSLEFMDEQEPGKVFNISERMHAVNLSWKAGYTIIPREVFEVNGFVGFGLQLRFKETTVNSYGYNFDSHQFNKNETTSAAQFAPLLHAGVKIGFKKTLRSTK